MRTLLHIKSGTGIRNKNQQKPIFDHMRCYSSNERLHKKYLFSIFYCNFSLDESTVAFMTRIVFIFFLGNK